MSINIMKKNRKEFFMKWKIIILSVFLLQFSGYAQDSLFWNKKMLDIAHKRERTGWVDIKEEFLFSKDNFFVRNKEAFRLASNDSMKHLSSTKKR